MKDLDHFHTAKVAVPDQIIIDQFITACEGGSNYWCAKVVPRDLPGDAYEIMLRGFTVIEAEGDKKHRVTTAMIKQAIDTMATRYPSHFADMIGENGDATTGDIFLQLCVFGELIYG